MIILPQDYNLDLQASDLVRSPGVHASALYGALYEELDPKRYKYDGPPNPMSLAMGTAWENHLEYLLVKNDVRAFRPGEYLSPPEGPRGVRVAYSPDLIILNGKVRCGEMKWTSKSAKGLPTTEATFLDPKFDKYLCQLMLYIYWLRRELDEEVQGWLALALMFEAYNPQFRAYNIDFTDEELAENHAAVINNAIHKGLI